MSASVSTADMATFKGEMHPTFCKVTYLFRFNGAPGGIRTPDHLVRSQALESALKSINTEIIVNEGS